MVQSMNCIPFIIVVVFATIDNIGDVLGEPLPIITPDCDPCTLVMKKNGNALSDSCVETTPIVRDIIARDELCRQNWDAYCILAYNDCYNEACGPTKQSYIDTIAETGGIFDWGPINREEIKRNCPSTKNPTKAPTNARPKFLPTTINKKPNILIILADDVGTGDIPYYYNTSRVDMPNIGDLSAKGVTFFDAHSAPNCAPSRYMMLSGNFAHRGVRPRGTWVLNEEDEISFTHYQKSIAQTLRDEGKYTTGMFGKWHLGGGVPRKMGGALNKKNILTDPMHDWKKPIVNGPQEIGFSHSFITTAGIQKPPYAFYKDGFLDIDPTDAIFWKDGKYSKPHGISKIRNEGSGEGDKDWDSSAYNMIVVNETKQFIWNHLQNNSDNPFFAYVALGAVHRPHSPPDKYIDGSQVKNKYGTRHMDMLLEMDKSVESLVTLIENEGIANETIIIFTSDNGGLNKRQGGTDKTRYNHHSSGIFRGNKGMVYEGGHRVPFIFRWDQHFPAGKERGQLVGLNDIYATICDLVDIDVPHLSAQDSMSFATTLYSEDKYASRKIFVHIHVDNDEMKSQAYRENNLKLVNHVDKGLFELYDLGVDPGERINLYTDKDGPYKATIESMYDNLIAVGPCPMDINGIFRLSTRNKRRDARNDFVGCNWFKENTTRCNECIEGRQNCNSICANNLFKVFCKKLSFPRQLFSSKTEEL